MNPELSPYKFGTADILVVAIMNLMWGLNMVALKVSVDVAGPLTSAFLRQMIVFAACLPFLRIFPGKMRELLGLGVLSGGFFYIVNNIALGMTDDVAALAIAGQLGAPISIILAIILFKERISRWQLLGMLLAFGGISIVVFDPRAFGDIDAFAVISVASTIWGVCALIQRRLVGVPPLAIYAWVGVIGSIVIFPFVVFWESEKMRSAATLDWRIWGWIFFSAICSTVIGQGAMSWLIQRHPISTIIPLTLATPVIAVVSSNLYFDAPFTESLIFGGAIAIAGIALLTARAASVEP